MARPDARQSLLDHAIGHGVLLQGALLRLDAEIDQGSGARALRATADGGSDPHDTARLHGDLLAIQGEATLAAQDDVELLVLLVVVEEGDGLARSQRAERHLHAGRADHLFQECLALEGGEIAYCGYVVALA